MSASQLPVLICGALNADPNSAYHFAISSIFVFFAFGFVAIHDLLIVRLFVCFSVCDLLRQVKKKKEREKKLRVETHLNRVQIVG